MKITYSPKAWQQIHALPTHIHERIVSKLHFFADQPHPIRFAKSISQTPYYRFRIGDYRAIFVIVNQDTISIVKIDKRDKVYN